MKIIGMIGKAIGILFLILILLFITFMIVAVIITKLNDSYKGNYKTVIKAGEPNAPKALIVYQPAKSKISDSIAKQLAKGMNEDGYEVTISYPGKHLSTDITQYSIIAFGSPVYFGKPSSAVTNMMKQIKNYSDKTIIIYSVGQLTEAKELDYMKTFLTEKQPDASVKFITKDSDVNKKAYELGIKAGKESRG